MKVPLFVKLRATNKLAGEVSVLDAAMVIPPKLVVLVPPMVDVPLNTTVPALLVNVPLLVQVPATLILVLGAVNELEALIVTLLKELVLVPEMTVVPPKVTVEEPEFRVPLFIRFPLIANAEVGVSEIGRAHV